MTCAGARSLDGLVKNMMLDKQIFFAGYGDEELERAKPMFAGGGPVCCVCGD